MALDISHFPRTLEVNLVFTSLSFPLFETFHLTNVVPSIVSPAFVVPHHHRLSAPSCSRGDPKGPFCFRSCFPLSTFPVLFCVFHQLSFAAHPTKPTKTTENCYDANPHDIFFGLFLLGFFASAYIQYHPIAPDSVSLTVRSNVLGCLLPSSHTPTSSLTSLFRIP